MALLQALRQSLRSQAAHGVPAPVLQQLRGFAAAPNKLGLIKELREMTGAPVTEVKAALAASDWDLGEQLGPSAL